MSRLPAGLAVLLAAGLGAQVPASDDQVAADGRSGTVVLRFQAGVRGAFSFTAREDGLTPGRNGTPSKHSQIGVATTAEGDEFAVDFRPGEVAHLLDLGSLKDVPGRSLFERVSVNEVRQRLQTRPTLWKRLPVQQDHVYLLAIDGASERFALPGDPLFVKLLVTAHEAGRQVTVRWAILNEPFALLTADGSVDLRRLPRLEPADGTTDAESRDLELLVAQLAKGDVDAAMAKLIEHRHKMLPQVVNLLCSLDPASEGESARAWSIDAALNRLVRGGKTRKAAPLVHTLDEHRTMVRYWYAFARRTRSPEQWQTALDQQRPAALPGTKREDR